MTLFDSFLTYFGCVVLVLTFLYGIKEYIFTLIGGFLAFCVYYFKFGVKDFEWTFSSVFPHLIAAGIIYGISYVIGVLFYKLFPLKKVLKFAA